MNTGNELQISSPEGAENFSFKDKLESSEIQLGETAAESAIDNATNVIRTLEAAQVDPSKVEDAIEFADSQLPVLYDAYEKMGSSQGEEQNRRELTKKIKMITEMQADVLKLKDGEDLAQVEQTIQNA